MDIGYYLLTATPETNWQAFAGCYFRTMISLAPVAAVLASDIGVRPPPVIDTNDDAATGYWAYRFGVSRDDLFAAIGEVGTTVAAVRRHLGK